jgi:hypothetical protein
MTDKIVAEVAKYFKCENCDYFTSKKSNYNKHLLTAKHKYLQNTDKIVAKVAIKFDCICGKSYKHRQSLYTHQSKCMFKDKESITQNLSQEFVLDVIKKQQDQITELTNTIKDMAPLINNTNNTNNTINNTQNNKFNINVFLNEQCKDAINMSDFIKSLHITIEQLDFTKQNGLAQGLSKSIIDNMNKLSIYQRPMHCTDSKRETLYIKDDDSWSKDGSKEKLKNVINKASSKNYNALMEWKTLNPDYMNNEDKTDYFTKTISTIGKPTSSIDDKVIKLLCKEIYIKES